MIKLQVKELQRATVYPSVKKSWSMEQVVVVLPAFNNGLRLPAAAAWLHLSMDKYIVLPIQMSKHKSLHVLVKDLCPYTVYLK